MHPLPNGLMLILAVLLSFGWIEKGFSAQSCDKLRADILTAGHERSALESSTRFMQDELDRLMRHHDDLETTQYVLDEARQMLTGGAGLSPRRFNVCIVAFARPEGMSYFPSWMELAVSAGIVAGATLVFIFFVERLKVYPEEHAAEGSASRDFKRWSLGI